MKSAPIATSQRPPVFSENKIIRDGAVVSDDWQLMPAAEAESAATVIVPTGNVLVPLKVWIAQREALISRISVQNQPIGVWLEGADDPSLLADSIDRFAVIAVNFPKFTDGRGYSTATLLRSRYGFTKELRAIGDVLRDQLFYLRRAGFNAFAVRADKDIVDALGALSDFSEVYQGAVDQPQPLFRRRNVDSHKHVAGERV